MPADSPRGPYSLNEVLPDLLGLQCDTMNTIDDAIDEMEYAFRDGKITADELPPILMKLHRAHAASGDAHNIAALLDERKPDAAKAAVHRRRARAAKKSAGKE